MTKANWKEAPHDAETYEVGPSGRGRFCKGDKFYSDFDYWTGKGEPSNWTILEHRPRIIEWEDMKEGMVVKCAESEGVRYAKGHEYPVRKDDSGNLGPVSDYGSTTIRPHLYTFELVSEPEQCKTVKDAVEHYKGEWPDEKYTHLFTTGPSWDGDICVTGGYEAANEKGDREGDCRLILNDASWVKVCTREQFEAEVNRREPEWTHTYGNHVPIKCKIIGTHDEHAWVQNEYGVKLTANADELKPIRPTITKAQAWDKLAHDFNPSEMYQGIVDSYDVV